MPLFVPNLAEVIIVAGDDDKVRASGVDLKALPDLTSKTLTIMDEGAGMDVLEVDSFVFRGEYEGEGIKGESEVRDSLVVTFIQLH